MAPKHKRTLTDDVDILSSISEEPEDYDPSVPLPESSRPGHKLRRRRSLSVTSRELRRSIRSSSNLRSDFSTEKEMLKTLTDRGLGNVPLQLRWLSSMPCACCSEFAAVHEWLMKWRRSVPHIVSPYGPESRESKALVRRDELWWSGIFLRAELGGVQIWHWSEKFLKKRLWWAGLDRETRGKLVVDIMAARSETRWFKERLEEQIVQWKEGRDRAFQKKATSSRNCIGQSASATYTSKALICRESPHTQLQLRARRATGQSQQVGARLTGGDMVEGVLRAGLKSRYPSCCRGRQGLEI